jgi:hypothetical protein
MVDNCAKLVTFDFYTRTLFQGWLQKECLGVESVFCNICLFIIFLTRSSEYDGYWVVTNRAVTRLLIIKYWSQLENINFYDNIY